MKMLVDTDGEGFLALVGQRITVFCMNYFYTGKLVGVNDGFIKLEKASIVYETGDFNEKTWKDAQPLPNDVYVMKSAIESFTVLK